MVSWKKTQDDKDYQVWFKGTDRISIREDIRGDTYPSNERGKKLWVVNPQKASVKVFKSKSAAERFARNYRRAH